MSSGGGAPPRVALFVLDAGDAAAIQRTLDRIPKGLEPELAEIVVMLERAVPPLRSGERLAGRPLPVRIHRDARSSGPGGARKAAFEYALREGFDHALLLRGDVHPPESLLELLAAVRSGPDRLVIGARAASPLAFAGGLQRRILGLRLRDPLSTLRCYPVRALACVPFQLDADDAGFDVELLIQLRALGIAMVEVAVARTWQEDAAPLRAARAAVGYRLHQLHATRDGRYLVDHGVRYTLKQSPTGSHMQIVEAIRPGSRVLDLGCSQGLLARPLRARGVRVTGVDANPPERLAGELEAYHVRDLEKPLELPEGRVFDYVICADVIEHLRERQQLLRSARRFVREDGRLVISTPNVALWFYRLSLLIGRFEYGPRGVLDRTHLHLYTRATFRREVERAGYRIVRERVTALPFEVVFESTGRSRLVRAVAKAYHQLAQLWPSLLAYQIVLEAEIATLEEATMDG